MIHPSLASEYPRMQETQSAHVATRIDLLGSAGEVELSWGLGNGRWSLGSGPQNDVRISDDASIAACHIQLTVGKRYTLLKAVGPIRIAGRPIREWLIDQSTLVECGGRWLVIHPNKQTSLAVVTHDRLSEIAERLASLNPPTIPPSDTGPSKDSESIVAEFRQEVIQDLSALRETVNAIHVRMEELPDLPQMESRIEQRTFEALQALKDELPKRVGDPIRAELIELIELQRATWDENLDSRHRQIEASIQTAALGFDQSVRSTNEHIELLQTQLDKLTDEQGDLRALFSRLENAHAESHAAIEKLSNAQPVTAITSPIADRLEPAPLEQTYGAMDVAPSLPPQFEPTSEFAASEFAASEFAASEFAASEFVSSDVVAAEVVHSFPPTEISKPSEISESPLNEGTDEVFEFQVDDESISQRLSRMLSDPLERRSTATRSKLSEEVVRSPESQDALPSDHYVAFGDQLDPEAVYTALSELKTSKTPFTPLTQSDLEAQESESQDTFLETQAVPVDIEPDFEPTAFDDVSATDSRDGIQEFGPREVDAVIEERILTDEDSFQEPQQQLESPVVSSGNNSGINIDEGSGEEDSIEEYMQRLLQRVRTGASAGEPPVPVSVDPVKPPVKQSVEQNDRVSATRGSSGIYPGISGATAGGNNTSARNRLISDGSNPPSSRTRTEVKSDIEALREIANSNARRAINRSVIRRKRSNVIIKSAVVVISLVCAIAMFLMNGFRVSATLGGFIIALVIAVLWGIDTAREAMSLQDEKKQREADNQSDLSDAALDTTYATQGVAND